MVGTVKIHEDAIQINAEKKKARLEAKKNNMLTMKVPGGPKSDMKRSLLGGKRKSVAGGSVMSSSAGSKFISRRNLFKPVVKHVDVSDFKFD
jgi:hypothetical protein